MPRVRYTNGEPDEWSAELFRRYGELPLTMRRKDREVLRPLIDRCRADLREVRIVAAVRDTAPGTDIPKLFGYDYVFTYDLLAILKAYYPVRERGTDWMDSDVYWISNWGNSIPDLLGAYFENTTKGLAANEFGTDNRLRQAFIQGTGRRVVELRLISTPVRCRTYSPPGQTDDILPAW
jgi:hypothetical protein